MVAGKSWVSFAHMAVLTVAIVSVFAPKPILAQGGAPADTLKPVVTASGAKTGRGAIGGQLGAGSVLADGDYSAGAQTRFSFSAHWRYVIAPWIRWQISPGFTWAGYDKKEPAPFRDLNFPDDSTKAEYLALVVPISAQLQFTMHKGPWVYYAGAGPGLYRVWVENRRKVLKDRQTYKLHRGVYPGLTVQVGVERFLKDLPSTSIEVSLDGHRVWAERDDQFPSGWNNTLTAIGLRVGGNYYFGLDRSQKPNAGQPGGPPGP